MTPPPEKSCSRCNRSTQLESNFCPWCGAKEFKVHSHTPYRLPVPQVDDDRLRLSIGRIVGFSVISLGLYQLYWAFFTWDQMKRETGGNFFPVWHALSLLVPIYGLFRMHHHIRLIKELRESSGDPTNLSPHLVVVMMLLGWILSYVTLWTPSAGLAIALSVISLVLTITILVWVQSELNAYWSKSRQGEVREARFSLVEGLVCLLGIALPIMSILVPFEQAQGG